METDQLEVAAKLRQLFDWVGAVLSLFVNDAIGIT